MSETPEDLPEVDEELLGEDDEGSDSEEGPDYGYGSGVRPPGH